ncbi:class I SAM-dependent methyltransferase [Bradyrhizobium sp. WSM 1738]|uniref:class I SAM-dependent methyltransferase n=1 Tax=Bradyrhizobium hereditatis TaxID=2821405 RepID=UPI001CE3782D|nr:class I SAM-dependent methyltransferase [Bradyrhizobium hereditatis]MCA6119207.1 class I SAM-dependent methyltransferase [Bradyrhizobium hereditatis]
MTSHNKPDDPIAGRLLESALRGAYGRTPENVALAQLLMAASCAEEANRALNAAINHVRFDPHERDKAVKRLQRMRTLWDQTPEAFASIKAVMHSLDHPSARDLHPSPEAWARIFDDAVGVSREASVALYCLGRADLLRAATDEIVERIRAWNLLRDDVCVLDVGCGSGRVVEALARHVRTAIGIDVSMHMLQAARECCAACPNAVFVRTSGQDLSVFRDTSVDLICAVDVFPYFVMSDLAQRHIGEMARVLRRNGHLLILNYAYSNDPTASENELRRFAQEAGLYVRHSAMGKFSLWDGTCFLLQKTTQQERST